MSEVISAARATVLAIFVSASLSGCAGGTPRASTGPEAPTATAARASPTASLGPRATARLVLVPPTIATFAPSGGATETWQLVALGDSNVAGWGINADEPFSPQDAFPGVYGQLLADEQSVEVELHSYFPDQLGNEVRTVAEWADVLAADESMGAALAEARMVILLIGFHDLVPAILFGACGATWEKLRPCLEAATAPMPAAFDRLYDAVRTYVPDDAIVLVNDYALPGPTYERWGAEPFWPELKRAMFDTWRDALETAALDHDFRVVHWSTALMTPDGAPAVDWRANTSDGYHFNAAGARMIAELNLAEDGIE